MAVMRQRGKKFNVWFDYRDETGSAQRQFETYPDQEQAKRRKKVIDDIQAARSGQLDSTVDSKLQTQVSIYRKYRNLDDLTFQETCMLGISDGLESESTRKRTHYDGIFSEFIEVFFPMYARLHLQPSTIEGWEGSLKNHIIPFFGHRVMNNLDEQDIDEWLVYMSSKKVSGSKAYNKEAEELELLSSATIAKAAAHLNTCFQYAKKRKWMKEELNVSKICVTYQETPYWTDEEFRENVPKLENPLIRLFVHLLFILSGRPGEPAGIQLDSINLAEKWIHIKQSLTRASELAVKRTDPKNVLFVFPKIKESSASLLILKVPKTKQSIRTVRITRQLVEEIEARLKHINCCKQLYGEAYQNYNLLICQDSGRPFDVRNLQKHFKKCQEDAGIENVITLRGLRKSSLIYKNNITGNDYTLVMKDSGHTQVSTLLKHYDDVNDKERVHLASQIEDDLYDNEESADGQILTDEVFNTVIRMICSDPEKKALLMQQIISLGTKQHRVQ